MWNITHIRTFAYYFCHFPANSAGSNTIPISQFLKTDMTNKVIVAMEVPAMTDDYIVRLYKVAQRAEVSS